MGRRLVGTARSHPLLPCCGDDWHNYPPGIRLVLRVGKDSAAGMEGGPEGGAG
ncbi:Hypothetical predicted protein, partial [Marmota monax]